VPPLLFAYPIGVAVFLVSAFGLIFAYWAAKQFWPAISVDLAANGGPAAGSQYSTVPPPTAWPRTSSHVHGTTTFDEVARLAAAAHARRGELNGLSRQLSGKQRLLPIYKFGIAAARSILAFRSFTTSAFPLGRPACWLVMIAVAIAMGVISASLTSLTGRRLFAGGLCGGVFGALLTTAMIYFPVDEFWSTLLDLDEKKLADLTNSVRRLEQQVAEAKGQYASAHNAWQHALIAYQSRLNQLLLSDWRCLRGIPFEEFLKEVFEAHGCQVETTKASGDQGVDLIVTHSAERVAVQVKGYANSVGNDAVQQAFTGMAYYGCQRCVVITNSTFTGAAKDVALKLGICTLIDGSQIDALIRGSLRI
jgi:hypothetical protein